ncbi:MAG: ATP-binding protein [Actinomycetaceae bacterium]|nr:ATP-binding protein [Actinomycetaceae bacterium]
MERHLMARLEQWRTDPYRKPLILSGARQVGKTWLLKEFGRRYFSEVAYVNFDNQRGLATLFEEGYDLDRILIALQAQTGTRIADDSTLLILDEIQECPKALTSLKYFREQKPQLAIAAAGSLLGLTVHEGTGFPVGAVTSLDLYPLNFREFLDATGRESLREVVDMADSTLFTAFSARLTAALREYFFTGGMPEAVLTFQRGGELSRVRESQLQILRAYAQDISKHLPLQETERTLALWRTIPAHLGQENKKFVFGHIASGARARDYRSAVTWLTRAGLAVDIRRVSKPGIPLSAYAQESIFKLFTVDIGLLAAMAGLDERSIVQGNAIFTEFKGALTEQYVCQQLISDCGLDPYYWSADNSRGEVDFLFQDGNAIYPVEVKAEVNVRSRSLRAFSERFDVGCALRFSLADYVDQGWMKNIPLYAISARSLWREESK